MSSGRPGKSKKSKQEKLASIAEWDAILGRYPPGNRLALIQQIVFVLASNAFTVYLLMTHKMQPLHLVLLVAVEAVLLSVIAFLQSLTVPLEARKPAEQTLPQRIGTLIFGLFWLGFVYSFVFAGLLRSGSAFLSALHHPVATIQEGGLLWPLAITLLAASVDSFKDSTYFRDHGGTFMSTPGLNALARWLTLFLGAIPFLIPLAAVGWAISEGVKRWTRSRKGPIPTDPKAVLFVIPLLALGVFGVMGGLLSAGLSGWAIGYCAAKFASELLVLCIPVIAWKAKAEEVAAL